MTVALRYSAEMMWPMPMKPDAADEHRVAGFDVHYSWFENPTPNEQLHAAA